MVKNLPAKAEAIKRRVQSLGWEDPLKEGVATTPVFLPGESYGRGRLEVHRVTKCRTPRK